MFRKSVLERRCVIPTTGFYEWGPGAGGKKRKYRFNLPGERALYLAGLWNEFAGERKCVILTTAANASMEGIHDRDAGDPAAGGGRALGKRDYVLPQRSFTGFSRCWNTGRSRPDGRCPADQKLQMALPSE